jgi:hypothetical protein
MAKSRTRSQRWKRSVVITFSAASSLVGCGTTDQAAPTDGGLTHEQTDSGPDGSTPRTPDTSCPASLPRAGDPCRGTDLYCSYDGGICAGGEEASCSTNVWQIGPGHSCNPPYYPPDAGDNDAGDAG